MQVSRFRFQRRICGILSFIQMSDKVKTVDESYDFETCFKKIKVSCSSFNRKSFFFEIESSN